MKIKAELYYLTVGDLKKIISDLPDETEVMIQKLGGVGNIAEINSVRKSKYGFFGTLIDCIVLDNTGLPTPSRTRNVDNDSELYEGKD